MNYVSNPTFDQRSELPTDQEDTYPAVSRELDGFVESISVSSKIDTVINRLNKRGI